MTLIPKPKREDIVRLFETLKAVPGAPKEHLAAGLIWGAASNYTEATNGDELEFADVAIRLLAGTLAKADRQNAAAYLDALADYVFAGNEVSREQADQAARAAFLVLRTHLALADTPAGGQA